jgi:prepilin-type processing-associated H-X9-DG protein
LLPALSKAKIKAEGVVCISNEKQLLAACAMYPGDNANQLVSNPGGASSTTAQGIAFGTGLVTNWVGGWLDWNQGLPAGYGVNTNLNTLLNTLLGPYTAKAQGVYKCPSDKIPSAIGPRVRSISMNGFVGGQCEWTVYGYTSYRVYMKDSDFTVPGPSKTWIFVDEHPDSINDGLFGMHMPGVSGWPTYTTWEDTPASYHNHACGFGFADGHAEIHKWFDANTLAPILKTSPSTATGTTSQHDSEWIIERTSAPQ